MRTRLASAAAVLLSVLCGAVGGYYAERFPRFGNVMLVVGAVAFLVVGLRALLSWRRGWSKLQR